MGLFSPLIINKQTNKLRNTDSMKSVSHARKSNTWVIGPMFPVDVFANFPDIKSGLYLDFVKVFELIKIISMNF